MRSDKKSVGISIDFYQSNNYFQLILTKLIQTEKEFILKVNSILHNQTLSHKHPCYIP